MIRSDQQRGCLFLSEQLFGQGNTFEVDVHSTDTCHSGVCTQFFSFSANYLAQDVLIVPCPQEERHVHDLADTQETLSTTTGDSTSTSTNAQARHVSGHLSPEAYSARWDLEYGRLAINSPRARCEHNMAGALTPPATKLTNTSSRQQRRAYPGPPLLQHAREESEPLTLLVGSATPRAGCRGTSEKQVGTWFAQGKDQSPMNERKQQEIEFIISANKMQFIFQTWRNNKFMQEKVLLQCAY